MRSLLDKDQPAQRENNWDVGNTKSERSNKTSYLVCIVGHCEW